MDTSRTLPPKEIFDLLHECEKHGIKLPEAVDKWWVKETEFTWKDLDKTNLDVRALSSIG